MVNTAGKIILSDDVIVSDISMIKYFMYFIQENFVANQIKSNIGLGLSGTIWDYLGLSGTILVYLGLSGSIWDFLRLGCK